MTSSFGLKQYNKVPKLKGLFLLNGGALLAFLMVAR